MNEKADKIRQRRDLISEINSTLNLYGISRLNPIFAGNPKFKSDLGERKNIIIKYGDEKSPFKETQFLWAPEQPQAPLVKPYYWLIFANEDIAIRFEEISERVAKIFKQDKHGDMVIPKVISLIRCEYFQIHDTPIYIKVFGETIKKRFKKSVIFIDEILPIALNMTIIRKSNSEEEKESVLSQIAIQLSRWKIEKTAIPETDEKHEQKVEEIKQKVGEINRKINEIIKNQRLSSREQSEEINKLLDTIQKIYLSYRSEVKEIIKNRKLSFKERLDEINKLFGTTPKINFSYCIACGHETDKSKKFCNAKMDHKSNKYNCLNKFNYWLEARLGITEPIKIAKKREKYYREFQDMIRLNPFSGFKKFKANHPKLYTERYKERWQREKKQS